MLYNHIGTKSGILIDTIIINREREIMEQEFIGIDLGSNSLRGVRMCVSGDAKKGIKGLEYTTLKTFDANVRTAEGLESSGEICNAAVARIVDNLLKMRETLEIVESDCVIALTTQAMRKARNREQVLQEIFRKSGIAFQVIDGAMEAKITALPPKIAMRSIGKNNYKFSSNCFLLIDMGGASSEFIVCGKDSTGSEIEFARSFEIGIVSAKDRYGNIAQLLAQSDEFLAPIVEFMKSCKKKGAIPKFVVANSGTPTIVCALKLGLQEYDPKAVFGKELTKQDFNEVLAIFSALDTESQIARVGKYKADVVPYGIALFTCFIETLGFEECLVLDEGLREGAVLARVLGLLKA